MIMSKARERKTRRALPEIRRSAGGAVIHIGRLAVAAAVVMAIVSLSEGAGLAFCHAEEIDPAGKVCVEGGDRTAETMADWYNGSNIALHQDPEYWEGNSRFRRQVRGLCAFESGHLVMKDAAGGSGWRIGEHGEDIDVIEKGICIVLEAFWKYASDNGGFINISGARGNCADTVWITLNERDGLNIPSLCGFVFKVSKTGRPAAGSGAESVAPCAAGVSRAEVIYEMGMNYRTSQLTELISKIGWQDLFIKEGRILDRNLLAMNREIMERMYGDDAGRLIFEFADEKYRNLYCKDLSGPFLRRVDLPNETRMIGGCSVTYNDDQTARTTLHIRGR